MKFNYTQASSKDGNRLLLATSSPSMVAGQQSLISMDQFWIRSHLPATTIDKVSWVWMVQFTVCDMLIDSFNDRLAPVVGCSRSDRCYWKGECNIHSLVRWEIAWGWEHTSRNRKACFFITQSRIVGHCLVLFHCLVTRSTWKYKRRWLKCWVRRVGMMSNATIQTQAR